MEEKNETGSVTSRAQRRTEGEGKSAATPAAGQAGMATSRDMTIARIVRDSICWVFDAAPQVLARIDDDYLESIIAKRAPVAAATEQATKLPEGWEPIYLVWHEDKMLWVDDGLAEYEEAAPNNRRIAYQPKEST